VSNTGNRESKVFTYPVFDVEIVREVDVNMLGCPEPGDATNGAGLGINREYVDLRCRSWAEARRMFALEGDLIRRIERADDAGQACDRIDEELYERDDDGLFCLDIGVAATVVCLSAGKCVPFYSCNAGVFGGQHHAAYPQVAFFARVEMVDLLLVAAGVAEIGLHMGAAGDLVAYANDIRNMRRFAAALLGRSSFNLLQRTKHPAIPEQNSGQGELPFK